MEAALKFLNTKSGMERALIQAVAQQALEIRFKENEQLAVLIANAVGKMFNASK